MGSRWQTARQEGQRTSVQWPSLGRDAVITPGVVRRIISKKRIESDKELNIKELLEAKGEVDQFEILSPPSHA